ncbi:MAG: sugar ABC transporter ATP-binding protein [Solirubrobacterales bacterium]|jgi:ribose transport system ATP-binding protein|nr:sugar ABC transporter ATP-binding protein [Solirubrobacterales bacterium]
MPSSPSQAPTESQPVLDVRGASKRFAGVVALDDVSLHLAPGEVHALVGENGAGKSTLIKVINGVHPADAGEVRLAGELVAFAGPRDAQEGGISTIFQEVNLVPLMTVAQNVFLGRELRGRFGLIDRQHMEREARELLHDFGVDVDVSQPLRSLGVGIQQMVAIARAVSLKARVVIMDEPTSSLEPREVEVLFGVIRRLRDDGVAVIYVSHKLDELFVICERVTVLRDGRLVHTGPIAGLNRTQLVAHMLGRDVAEVERHGVTSFGEGHEEVTAAPVLEVTGLTREPVLHGVSLAVRPGEVVGLGGLLGAGRSETAKAIAGAEPLDAGEVKVGGRAVRRGSPIAAVKAGIAIIPEDRKAEGIIPQLSVRDNITIAALPRLSKAGLVSEKAQDELVETFMRRLRIKASSPDQKVLELSGGNQQKVLLARCLCMSPKVLILDEPTRGIDVGAKGEIQALVDELAEQGLAVVLISSELEEVVEGADQVVVLKEGAVIDVLRGEDVTEDKLVGALSRG